MKDIEGFPKYTVSRCGRIHKGDKEMYTQTCRAGYTRTGLTNSIGKRKMVAVHRLVAIAFVAGRNEVDNEVNHINGIKSDNRAENLEGVSHSYNLKHAYNTGLHSGEEKRLRNKAILDLSNIGYSQDDLADIFDVRQPAINSILKRYRSQRY